MDGFEDKLRELLSSPEDMEKLAAMAKSIAEGLAAPTAAGSGEAPGLGPEDGGDGGDGGAAVDAPARAGAGAAPAVDPAIFGVIARVMGAYSSGAGAGDKTALLGAIRPYLKSDRREYMDKAAEMVKLTRIARAAFNEFSGGDVNV
ncbi:MAG: hypothetical protein LBS51_05665 [Oscillospiraceae bacterium]|nr:hypothetical protein [Oscillospiraceae bacterium]